MNVPWLVTLAPLFLAFEAWQLLMSERLLGLKQIARGGDPRDRGPSEAVAAGWSLVLILYWAWMPLMLIHRFGRAQTACILVVTLLGYSIRRNCGLNRILVFLTIEGAIRMGMLLSLTVMAWRRW